MKAGRYTRETIREMGMIDRKLPEFREGDTIAVSLRIRDAKSGKERVQVFQGDVICIRKEGASSTFTVRKIGENSVAVERIIPYHSPLIDSIKVIRRGDVRRAKLFYVRDRVGKDARIKELVLTKAQKEQAREVADQVVDSVPEETSPDA